MTFIKMESYTIQQRVQIFEWFYANRRSVKNVFRKLRDIYGLHNRPSESTIKLFKNFKKLVRWEEKNINVPVAHKSILIWLVKVLPKIRKWATEPQLCQNVQNFDKRVDVCGAARGDHLLSADIVFRI